MILRDRLRNKKQCSANQFQERLKFHPRGRTFEHDFISLDYDTLRAKTTEKGRYYETPDGNKLPSVTTVLSILSEEGIAEWKKKVGAEEAARVSAKASKRGNAVHDALERYVRNDKNFTAGLSEIEYANFCAVQPVLDSRLGTIYGIELPLYSAHLGLAGRSDLIADFDAVRSIIDYKTSGKLKRKDWIEQYFVQEAAYAIAFEEQTGIPIKQLVTIIAVDDEPEPQIFIEDRDNWTTLLIETIDRYTLRMNNLVDTS